MFRFEHPIYLNLMLALPLLVILYWVYLRWKKNVAKKLGDSSVVNRLLLDVSPFRMHLKFILLMLSLASLLIALANPQDPDLKKFSARELI